MFKIIYIHTTIIMNKCRKDKIERFGKINRTVYTVNLKSYKIRNRVIAVDTKQLMLGDYYRNCRLSLQN